MHVNSYTAKFTGAAMQLFWFARFEMRGDSPFPKFAIDEFMESKQKISYRCDSDLFSVAERQGIES